MPKTTKLDAAVLRQVAVAATCDPRSIQKYLAGGEVRPTVKERISRALMECGMKALVRA